MYQYDQCFDTMVEQLDKPIPLPKCSLEADGTVTCSLKKEIFNELQRKNIKPKRVIWELE